MMQPPLRKEFSTDDHVVAFVSKFHYEIYVKSSWYASDYFAHFSALSHGRLVPGLLKNHLTISNIIAMIIVAIDCTDET
jgi:hypothetical protein